MAQLFLSKLVSLLLMNVSEQSHIKSTLQEYGEKFRNSRTSLVYIFFRMFHETEWEKYVLLFNIDFPYYLHFLNYN